MALKIRMRKQGRTNSPFYRVVVTDAHNKRDGKYVEAIGWYNPLATEQDKNLALDAERAEHWLNQGAIATEKVEALLRKAAPEVVKRQTEKVLAKRAKTSQKRKARAKRSEAAN
jgi:small subunit ribosomal protein S16